MEKAERTIYFDYLRVFAVFAVIIIHLSAQNFESTDVNGFAWQTFNFFNSMARWSVPVFVMISGALFVGREIPVKTLYTKYVLRMVISFLAWSVVYAVFSGGYAHKIDLIIELLHGHYHMWYIPMIIGLYISVPVINKIAENETVMKYYLALAFVFAFLVPWITTLAYDFAHQLIVTGVAALRLDIDYMYMNIVLGYAGYFILGYYLNKAVLGKRQRIVIYLTGIIGFVLTIGLDSAASLKVQKPWGNYYGYFNVNVLLECIGVFVWFKYRKYTWTGWNLFVQKLSKYSFGAYLVHLLVLEQLNDRFGLNSLSFHPVIAMICLGGFVFAVSFFISALLNQIPIVKKYMV